MVAGGEKKPPVVPAAVEAAGVVPKLKGDATEVWGGRAEPKLKPPPLVPVVLAVEVVMVGKLKLLAVVLGALAPPAPPAKLNDIFLHFLISVKNHCSPPRCVCVCVCCWARARARRQQRCGVFFSVR